MTVARGSTLTLAVLAAAGATTDVIGYLGLDHVFPANMTGNTVLLGISLATADLGAFSRSATALVTYLAAVVVAGMVRPERATALLLSEAGLLAAFGVWSAVAPTGARFGLIILAAAAMGVQSQVVLHIGSGGVTTTYITGMWTGLTDAVGARLRRAAPSPPGSPRRQAVVILTYAATACLAAAGYTAWPRWIVVAPAVLAGVAAVLSRSQDPAHR